MQSQLLSRVLFVVLLIAASPLSIHGQNPEAAPGAIEAQARLGITMVGVDTDGGPRTAAELTYLGSTPRLWRAGWIAGVFATTLGSLYAYGGIHLPIYLPLGMVARPSFSVGLYERGRGMELGHVLEFRSSFVLERELSQRFRVSAMLYHLSNAGLGFKNPGLEALGVALALPL